MLGGLTLGPKTNANEESETGLPFKKTNKESFHIQTVHQVLRQTQKKLFTMTKFLILNETSG